MCKKRNGLLEIYRLLLCFWPLYFHNFLFGRYDNIRFTTAELAVDFFFLLSGFFLLGALRKEKDSRLFAGLGRLIYSRLKPMLYTIGFIVAFNLVCVAIFVREDYLQVLFDLFKYWWFVLGLLIAIGLFYLFYRLFRSEKLFALFLVFVTILAASVHYIVNVKGMWHINFIYFTRTYGCISVGMLLSLIPRIKVGRFNYCIPIVAILIPTLLYLAYGKKNYYICLFMILLFGALVYFSYGIPVGGRVFDFLGRLSVKIYLYMALLTMLRMMGLAESRLLFVIDILLALMNTLLEYYRDEYKRLKKQNVN